MSPSFLSFDDVEQRLVEALEILGRMPDPSRHSVWLRIKISSVWAQATDDAETARANYVIDEFDQDKAQLRTRSATRSDIDAMNEALAWVEILEPADRKLVAAALRMLVAGRARIGWGKLVGILSADVGPDALRKRYGAALRVICMRVNASADAPRDLSRPQMEIRK